ncbi:MAG: amidohydrolase family protein [Alphaproteobacteria bacterium]|nr:amidohydrolase family protein [Alphaproteobacteria bacterium]
MTIDMHAHWRPPELIDALRNRDTPPKVETNSDGMEILNDGRWNKPTDEAFDDVDARLAEMDALGISTAVLSLGGGFTWIERLAVQESLPLVRTYNDSVSAICQKHEGRFAGFASLPEANIAVAAEEFDRALSLPGMVGAQVPGNGFLTYGDAEQMRPILEVANKHKAVVFVHFGPRPGDNWPRVAKGADNHRRRIGTLDMQASLSSNMVTLCLTDYLDDYPDAKVQLHNLGGNIPFEIERMDHRCLLDTPDEELPSKRIAAAPVIVDCNSFGARAIEAGVRAYGEDRIVFGTDGSAFGCDWSTKALSEADIGDTAKQKILHHNAANMLSHLVPLAKTGRAAQ